VGRKVQSRSGGTTLSSEPLGEQQKQKKKDEKSGKKRPAPDTLYVGEEKNQSVGGKHKLLVGGNKKTKTNGIGAVGGEAWDVPSNGETTQKW